MPILAKNNMVGFIVIAIVSAVILIALFVLLYIFVFSRNAAKRQIRELEKKYSYLDALLIGQDSQYIHRLEIISHTNLLYVDKYTEFSKRFKEIFDNDDKFAESMIKQLKSLIANNQYKNIKQVIADAKKTIELFEESVNELDRDLYQVIKPEEEARQAILKIKENYRRVKQIFYSNSNDLELVSASFTKVFDKLDQSFTEFEGHIESAEYEEANALLPTIEQVVNALSQALEEMPNLCILVETVVPEKIIALKNEYEEVENQGVPLFNLSFNKRVNKWNNQLANIKERLINLSTEGCQEELEQIQKGVEEIKKELHSEVEDKNIFEKESDELYAKVIRVEKSFLKICSLLPEIKEVYIVEQQQLDNIDTLKENMNKLGDSKRSLDNFIHSGTKQPYSILRQKLAELQNDYDNAKVSLDDFQAYLDSLKNNSEEAYSLVFVYYYRCKQIEATLRDLGMPEFALNYQGQLENCYELLNEIDSTLKVQPINVALINEKVEQLKNLSNNFFEEVENRYREQQLAESAIVYANRDRNHQTDVHQQLSVLEKSFFQGDFVRVYHDANAIFQRNHVEEKSSENN
ncbi:MAG: septation ring formation regulator EzrA [Bacilli bacterium]|nr:septation ring formation regulator EzrA [Bacilli bacterium]